MSVSSMEPWTACPFLTSALELAAAGGLGPSDSGFGGARLNPRKASCLRACMFNKPCGTPRCADLSSTYWMLDDGGEDADKQSPQRKPDEVPDGVDHAIVLPYATTR
jgi:hypothetical protein